MGCISSRLFALIIVLVFIIAPANGFCQDQDRIWNYALYFENDTFAHTDHLYSSGIRFSATSPGAPTWEELGFMPGWFVPLAKRLPLVNTSGHDRSMSFTISQHIYTPEKYRTIAATEPNRPYVGMLYASVAFNSSTQRFFNMLELTLGIMGPHSYAEDTQKAVHDILGQDSPEGWVNQVPDELFFDIQVAHRQRWTVFDGPAGLGMEVIPSVGLGTGRALFHGQAGFRVRFGWNLPADFGDDYIRAGATHITPMKRKGGQGPDRRSKLGIFVFGGADGQVIFWDITLHGELYESVDTVDEENFRYALVGGVGLILGPLKVCYSHVHASKAYKTQEKNQEYATILLTLSF